MRRKRKAKRRKKNHTKKRIKKPIRGRIKTDNVLEVDRNHKRTEKVMILIPLRRIK